MAIWELKFFIVKKEKKSLLDKCENVDDIFDEVILWGLNSLEKKDIFLIELEEEFCINESWTNNIKQYGNSDSTNLQFYYENGSLLEILCSIDVRNVTLKQIECILKFINSNNGLIFYNGGFYIPTLSNIKDLIINSEAFRFCNDPRGYISKSGE